MSTRATYEFKATDYTPAQTFYIHHDGYREGAASYFYNMLRAAAPCTERGDPAVKGGLTAAFVVGNASNVEFHQGRDTQGDLEFNYIIDTKAQTITVQERIWGNDGFDGNEWKTEETVSILDFIAAHVNTDWIDDYSQLISVEFEHWGNKTQKIVTRDVAAATITQELAAAADVMARSKCDNNPNITMHLNKAAAYQKALNA